MWLRAIPNQASTFAVFGPVVKVLNVIANVCTRLLGVDPAEEVSNVHTAGELGSMLAASRQEGLIAATAHDLLSGALDFGERSVAEVMVPRERIVSVAQATSVEDAEALVVASGHSRLVVCGADLDDIVGFVHAKDLLTVPAGARRRPIPIARIRRVLVLPPDRPLDDVLRDMRRTRTHVGVVRDNGRTLGLLTLEDVLEDLVGDIRDETDPGARPRITLLLASSAVSEGLGSALAEVLGAESVEGLRRLTGGASRETWSFTADGERLILQRERAGGGRVGGGMAGVAALIVGAAAAGVPVAPLVATGDASSPLGAPFMILGHVDGETIPRKLLRDDDYAEVRPKLASQLGTILAAMHRIDRAAGPDLVEQDQVRQFVDLLDVLGRDRTCAFELGFRWPTRTGRRAARPRSSTATSAPAT